MGRPIILINSHFRPGKHNYYEIPERYFESVIENGGLPILAPANANEALLREYSKLADAFLFSGGDDYPPHLYGESPHSSVITAHKRRVDNDLLLMQIALQSSKPILAICAGHQLLQIVSGGKLIQHLETEIIHTDENYHSVNISPESIIYNFFQKEKIIVNSSHHQAIDPGSIPEGFRITATADDQVIEAMENNSGQWVLSLQWHPERINDLEHRKLIFKNFIELCDSMGRPF
ncbi:MAG TPA: gamma-glutamyl-gamma-aminobutyrate hydrolase family protein [Candidatus Marinimicrobia bacterium]|nr:gamma-glutamyl-gamma-aminobutyrate hydrolase family protein [Candidatus Neomarinimicrobiota bacterium]